MEFFCSAQNDLILRRLYRLDNCSAIEEIGGYNGTLHGSATSLTDRFGNSNGAINFSDSSYISIPSPLLGFNYQETGYTIAFWTYIDVNLYKEYGTRPWTDSDPIYRAFYSINTTDQCVLTGFHRRADRMVLDRYTTNTQHHIKNWGIWLWDPINFTQRLGWYFIVISYEPSRTFIRVFYPDGTMESCMHYFGIQDYSIATHWGIGNSGGKSMILDGFSVYQGAASEDQARDIYAGQVPPNGMYKISLKENPSCLIHSQNDSPNGNSPVEIKQTTSNNLHTYKWVITPVYGKNNVYTIRMAYEEVYLHLYGHHAEQSNRVEILEYQPSNPLAYQWYIESSSDGYYYIRSELDRTKYLHPYTRSYQSGTALEILTFSQGHADGYKWKLNLLKTTQEINNHSVSIASPYEVVNSNNTFLDLVPLTPIQGNETKVEINRGPNPSLLSHWWFLPGPDDSYKIYNATHTSYDLFPKDGNITQNNEVVAKRYSFANNRGFLFTLSKPNPYGRRFYFHHALNSDLLLTVNEGAIGRNTKLDYNDDNKNNQWALYKSSTPNANKQIYYISPGVYRIVSVANENQAITTRENKWTSGCDILLGHKNGAVYTSYYWIVDYERDANGNPVLDGTFTIQLFATDSQYWHVRSNTITNSAKIELSQMNKNHISAYKWFIKPSRLGDGSYYIYSAGNPYYQVHLSNHLSMANTQLELWPYDSYYSSTYRWKLEQVRVIAPFASGIHNVCSEKDQTKLLHIKSRSRSEGEKIEVLSYNSSYSSFYKWRFIKNDDNTYFIQNVETGLYIHPIAHSTINGTRLEQLSYNNSYSPYYKWIIIPGESVGTFKIISVADSTKYMHLSGHLALEGNEVEILLFNKGYENTYEWIID